MEVNTVAKNNSGQEFKVLRIFESKAKGSNRLYTKVLVKFLDTGTVKEAFLENAEKGKLRDDYAVTTYGVGYLGFRDKGIPYYNEAKQLWCNMMKRCYSLNDDKGYHGAVVVSPRWHCFANFLIDLPKLENFNSWLDGKKSKVKWQLDKDYDCDGTVYSLETCRFLTEYENKSLGAVNARAWDERYGRSKPQHKVLTRDLVRG